MTESTFEWSVYILNDRKFLKQLASAIVSVLFDTLGQLKAVNLPPGERDAFLEEGAVSTVLPFYF